MRQSELCAAPTRLRYTSQMSGQTSDEAVHRGIDTPSGGPIRPLKVTETVDPSPPVNSPCWTRQHRGEVRIFPAWDTHGQRGRLFGTILGRCRTSARQGANINEPTSTVGVHAGTDQGLCHAQADGAVRKIEGDFGGSRLGHHQSSDFAAIGVGGGAQVPSPKPTAIRGALNAAVFRADREMRPA